MKFTIIDNFLTEDLCKNLISDAEKLIKDNDFSKIHGNRKSLVNSNLNFRKLTDNSKSWKELESIINSQSFLELCCEKLSIKKKLVLKEFFKPNNHSKLFKKYKAISGSSVNKISTFALCKYLIMRLFRDLLRNLRFQNFFFHLKFQ